MTMLDSMRRHKAILKWSLGIVVVAFVVLYIPSFLRNGGIAGITGAQSNDVIATVEGHDLIAQDYQRMYAQQLSQMRQAYGGNIDENMLKQLGIGQRIIQQMVEEAAVVAEANRLGIRISDAELRERIVHMPGFQQNGQFIGDAAYRQILQMQRPPLRPAEFEDSYRRVLLADKLRDAVTSWVSVSDGDVDTEYRKRNEKVKVDLALFTADKFRAGIEPTDAELQAQFNAHQETYKIPEKRRVKFLSIDAEALKNKMTASAQEIDARYKDNIQTYSTPEQVRASHILLKTEAKDEATVKKAAEDVLKQAKGGADFAALAKKYSEDDSNKDKGGDLDYFGRGIMAKEFEEAAFAMQPGQISDLVKTQFGFHIIKLVDKKAATTRSLDEVRPQIEEQIKLEKAQAEASKTAEAVAKDLKDPADLDRIAKARGLRVGDSGLFAREEPLAGLGFAPAVSTEAFTMQQGKVSGELRTNQGLAFIALMEIKPPYVPKLDEVKAKVRDDVIRLKAVDLAKAKAAALAQAASKGNFAAAAKAAGVDVKTTDFVTRGSALPDVGVSGAVDDAIFALQPGGTTAPIATDNAVVVAQVKERQDIKPETMAAERDTLRNDLLQQRQQAFFAAYMNKAKQKMKISYNENTIRLLLGS
jgi:peptidyl-prolyl cis-trans isomerase D